LTHTEESAHRELQDSEMIAHQLDKHKYCYCIVFGRGWDTTERIIDLETQRSAAKRPVQNSLHASDPFANH